jgi:formylglycine-generating enzyme required for sulfatase activity
MTGRLACLLAVLFVALFTLSVLADEPGLVAQPPSGVRAVKTDRGFMVPYKITIPGSGVTFEMIPVPGGKFKMGSPASEKGRKDDEGPQVEIEISPFWIGKHEVTWAEYKTWMDIIDLFKETPPTKTKPVTDANRVDAVTAPSKLYDPTFTFTNGEAPNLPAVTMSQFAARQYTKWLSKLTGQVFRLPSEAEWEYAARAGTTTAYWFGDDPKKLGDHEWFIDNSMDKSHPVGTKKPNPWGLHDMLGSVSEWVLDEYSEEGYKPLAGKPLTGVTSIRWPTKTYPRTIRGGSWETTAEECRAAARIASNDREWTETDPNIPKSPWWFTDGPALSIGFRLVRPLTPPAAADLPKYWEADVEKIKFAVEQRLREGRGGLGVVEPK